MTMPYYNLHWLDPPPGPDLEERVEILETIIKEAVGPETFDKLIRQKLRRGEG